MNTSSQAQSLLYQPLQYHDSFRLLKVKFNASRGVWVGTLVEARIPSTHCTVDAPNYIALSYVWGEPTFNVANVDSIEINLSLGEAFGHLLFRITEQRELQIWVDQLCINQRDIKEKEQQVKLMWRIFAGAKQVIGWLGPAFEGSDEALDDLIVFAGAHDNASEGQYPQLIRRRFGEHPSVEAIFSYIGNIMLLGSDLRARMLRLFSLSWFSRRWIAQEVCLASDLLVCCGCRSISGEQLFQAISLIQMVVFQLVSPWLGFRGHFAMPSHFSRHETLCRMHSRAHVM